MSVRRPHLLFATTVLLAAASLAGCGSSANSATVAATPTSSATAPGPRPSGRPTGLSTARAKQIAQIQACFKAAGIPFPTGRPSRPPGATPGARPPGATPGATPPAGRGGGFGGGGLGGAFNSPEAQAALKACGITLPTGPPPTQ
jgi:hypothetical protein